MAKKNPNDNLLKSLADTKGLDKLRTKLYTARAALKQSAHDYAESALMAADNVLSMAQDSAPCVGSYDDFSEARRCSRMAYGCMEAAQGVNAMILDLEETLDFEADEANHNHKQGTLEFSKFAAILQSADMKINMAAHAMPQNSQPGSRFDGSVYTYTKPKEGEDG